MTGGPRDWVPSEIDEPAHPVWTTATNSSRPTVRNMSGWLSLILGTLALAYAIFQAGNFAVGHGFAASTVGLCAIAYGVFALALRRRLEATLRLAPMLGIILGIAGTGVMGTYVAAHYLNTGDATLPQISMVAGTDFGAMFEEQPQVSDPRLVVTDAATDPAAEEFQLLAQHAASAAFAIDKIYPAAKPSALSLSGADGILFTPDGAILAQLPIGTAVHYTVTPDQLNYTLTLVGSSDGTRVVYDGATGTIAAE